MTTRREVIYTHEELQERLTYWQEKLRLRDWIISVRLSRLEHLSLDGAAEIKWYNDHKAAHIRIRDPIDYPDNAWTPQDMEWSLVHELLHIHFIAFEADDDENPRNSDDIEQAIESITYGLIALERQTLHA